MIGIPFLANAFLAGSKLYSAYKMDDELKDMRREADKLATGLDMTTRQLYYGPMDRQIQRQYDGMRSRQGARNAAAGISGSSAGMAELRNLDVAEGAAKTGAMGQINQLDWQVRQEGQRRVDRLNQAIMKNKGDILTGWGEFGMNMLTGIGSMAKEAKMEGLREVYNQEIQDILELDDADEVRKRAALVAQKYGQDLPEANEMVKIVNQTLPRPMNELDDARAAEIEARVRQIKLEGTSAKLGGGGKWQPSGYESGLGKGQGVTPPNMVGNYPAVTAGPEAKAFKRQQDKIANLEGKLRKAGDNEAADWWKGYWGTFKKTDMFGNADPSSANQQKQLLRNMPEGVKKQIGQESASAGITGENDLQAWLDQNYPGMQAIWFKKDK